MAQQPSSPVVRLGLAIFVIGVVFVGFAFIAFFLGHHDLPLWLNLACLLVPVGIVMAVWAGVARGRAEQQQAWRDVERAAGR